MEHAQKQTNPSLVSRAKSGDAEAFSALYEGVYQDLYRFALYTLRNEAEAEDAVSEAVVSAFESIRKLRSEEAFRGWMFQILSNKCKKSLKARRYDAAWEEETASPFQADWDDAIMVRKAFLALSEKERVIVSLTVFAGYNSKEISKLMRLNPNTVRSIKNRSLEKMKAFLQ